MKNVGLIVPDELSFTTSRVTSFLTYRLVRLPEGQGSRNNLETLNAYDLKKAKIHNAYFLFFGMNRKNIFKMFLKSI